MAEGMPGEELPPSTLGELCWDDPDPAVVLGHHHGRDPAAAGAAVVRDQGGRRVGFVRLLVVAPDRRRAGLGRQLLASLADWARSQGAEELRLGGEAPHYLWPGVDVALTPALCLAEAAGYLDRGAALNLSCSTSVAARPPPDGVEIRLCDPKAADRPGAVDAVLSLVRAQWPWWEAEVLRSLAKGTCRVAVADGGRVLALGCHSVNRPGWFGPIGTDPAAGERGLGTAVLTAVLRDMAAAGHATAEIAWIGPVGFYAKTVGATVSRVCRTLAKPA